jgi:predicted DNA-binding transcriptional regulator AlpA
MTNEMTPGLIKQSEAASYLGLSEATLERDRWRGGDIPYIKIGPRAIRYDLEQLNKYIEHNTVRNISEKEVE